MTDSANKASESACRDIPFLPETPTAFVVSPLLFLPRHLAGLRSLFADFLLRRGRAFRRRHEPALGVLHLILGELPAFPVDVEDDPVRILELALKAFVLGIAEIEEERAAGLLDLLLLRGQVVALEAEVMDAGPARGHARADLALVLQ